MFPKKKIAIEANGCYWHTEQYKHTDAHLWKKKKVESKGFNLIQIWDDDWNNLTKRKIIISRLRSKFGLSQKIFARKCVVGKVNDKDAKKFLEANHLNGYVSATYNYGLYYGGELVEMITIGKSNIQRCLELQRVCTKAGYNVVGGFSKLIKYFRKNISRSCIISYADCDWCCIYNNGYTKVGFKQVKISSPDYTYNVNGKRQDKHMVQGKHAGDDLSETTILNNVKFYKIYDSGKLIFKLT